MVRAFRTKLSAIVRLTKVRIETLLEEAYNERMHLLTFLKMAEPGWFMKFMILGAQGVFFNGGLSSFVTDVSTIHVAHELVRLLYFLPGFTKNLSSLCRLH